LVTDAEAIAGAEGSFKLSNRPPYCVDKKDAVNFSRSKTRIFGFFNPKIRVFAFEKLQILRSGSVKFFSRQGRCKWQKQAKMPVKGGGES
jgi:hypothetical protein